MTLMRLLCQVKIFTFNPFLHKAGHYSPRAFWEKLNVCSWTEFEDSVEDNIDEAALPGYIFTFNPFYTGQACTELNSPQAYLLPSQPR
jgi:hypothetical protein